MYMFVPCSHASQCFRALHKPCDLESRSIRLSPTDIVLFVFVVKSGEMNWPWSPHRTNSPRAAAKNLAAKALSLPPAILLLSAFLAGSATTAGGLGLYRRYWRRIPTADWITPDILTRQRWIKGYVTRSVQRPIGKVSS